MNAAAALAHGITHMSHSRLRKARAGGGTLLQPECGSQGHSSGAGGGGTCRAFARTGLAQLETKRVVFDYREQFIKYEQVCSLQNDAPLNVIQAQLFLERTVAGGRHGLELGRRLI